MSTEPYVPTQEELRTDYIMAYDKLGGSQLLAGMAFDRGIAKVKADALREAAEDMDNTDDPDAIHIANGDADLWLKARADRIEGEA